MKRENGKQLTRPVLRQLHGFARQASSVPGHIVRHQCGVILHPTDYSEASCQAFELAWRLARDRGSRLVVMHVAEPVQISSLSMVSLPPLPKGYRGAWESRLRLIQPSDRTVRVEHRLEEGDVSDAILRVARETAPNLIVMAGRERKWLTRLLTKSVTEAVARRAPCPVLRLSMPLPGKLLWTGTHDASSKSGVNIRTILHPTDFRQPDRYGLELARSLARELGSELTITHVAPIRELYRKRGDRNEIEAALGRMVTSDSTVRARWVLLADDPAAEILWMAREGMCDLIVMGTHGRTGLRRLFARSVATTVRRNAPCPVLTLRMPIGYCAAEQSPVAGFTDAQAKR